MKYVAFLFHIYQPPLQRPSVLRGILQRSYIPLFNLLQNEASFFATVNVPLSLLAQLESLGHSEFLVKLKHLYTSNKIEFTGTGAYHPLLTKLPSDLVEYQILLQEYALGYYFGFRDSMEGADAIRIKSLDGFFPPEMSLNNMLLKQLDMFGYSWVLGDTAHLADNDNKNPGIYHSVNSNATVIIRDTSLSNMFAFNKDYDIYPILDYISDLKSDTVVIALDGETFGEHLKNGISFLHNFISKAGSYSIKFCKVSDTLALEKNICELHSLTESSWGAPIDTACSNPYPYWSLKGNVLHTHLWDLFSTLIAYYNTLPKDAASDLPANASLWNIDTDKDVTASINFNKLLASDVFWWASHGSVGSTVLYDVTFIHTWLQSVLEYSSTFFNDIQSSDVSAKVESITALLED
ncbi:MAG: hypothetical protein R3B92_01185 [Patescibacteria group bacterium]